MATRDAPLISVDFSAPPRQFQRPGPATTGLLADIDERQLSLMTAGGNPPQVRSCYLRATTTTSWTVPLYVPPACMEMDFAFLSWGIGKITVTSSVDTTGFSLLCRNPGDEENAIWLRTAGVIASAAGASSGRALTTRSAIGWTYTSQSLTLTIDNVDTECGIVAIATLPAWQPMTV